MYYGVSQPSSDPDLLVGGSANPIVNSLHNPWKRKDAIDVLLGVTMQPVRWRDAES